MLFQTKGLLVIGPIHKYVLHFFDLTACTQQMAVSHHLRCRFCRGDLSNKSHQSRRMMSVMRVVHCSRTLESAATRIIDPPSPTHRFSFYMLNEGPCTRRVTELLLLCIRKYVRSVIESTEGTWTPQWDTQYKYDNSILLPAGVTANSSSELTLSHCTSGSVPSSFVSSDSTYHRHHLTPVARSGKQKV